ncbi:MAG: hypothetical protein A3K19_09930 [Lentisphaerae bacterium RIFOXYB12_FULL_65_16]|nr:MAG: hypothetical protein A3K18_00665 [Lentisphaerae bacterium RIFOXYA12_64_32]OGV91272.1 MAG: hypothetical protein A3K19_09930 [Lentisphaerae bacterium RIFOXYB12_FULL_65_16]
MATNPITLELPDCRPETEFTRAEARRLFPSERIRRVLLVAPPDAPAEAFNYATAKRGRYWNFPPYGLGVMATLLRDVGITVRIVNLNHEALKACQASASPDVFHFDDAWKCQLRQAVDEMEPDIVGVTCMFTMTHPSAVRVCQELARLRPDLTIAFGGVHVTNCFMSRETCLPVLEDLAGVKLFFLFEADLAFMNFVNWVNDDTTAPELSQLLVNLPGRRYLFRTISRPGEKELNVIPAHDLMGTAHVSRHGVIGSFFCFLSQGTRSGTVNANRGCRGLCTYCSVRNFNGPGVRHRSAESVVDELELLRDRHGVRHVMWLDDDLLHDTRRCLELFAAMIERKLGMTWDCSNGVVASSCTEEIVSQAAASGCVGLNIGIESGNPIVLKKIRKPGGIKTFMMAAKVLRRHPEINTRGFLMIGFPDETYGMIQDTFRLAQDMGLDWYNITILQPLPNTPIFADMMQSGLIDDLDVWNIRYNSGPYGKRRTQMQDRRVDTRDLSPFAPERSGDVPSRQELDSVWFHLNFHLNFERLFAVTHPEKLRQQYLYVKNICDLVAPDDPFPNYFLGWLQYRRTGRVDAAVADKVEQLLCDVPAWQPKFDRFSLSVQDLRRATFPVPVALSPTRSAST